MNGGEEIVVQDDLSGKNLEKLMKDNHHYRDAVFSGKYMQVVNMFLKPKQDIPFEVHPKTEQFVRVEGGRIRIETWPIGTTFPTEEIKERVVSLKAEEEDTFVIHAGQPHRIYNPSRLCTATLYTIYAGEMFHKHGPSDPVPHNIWIKTEPKTTHPWKDKGWSEGYSVSTIGKPESFVQGGDIDLNAFETYKFNISQSEGHPFYISNSDIGGPTVPSPLYLPSGTGIDSGHFVVTPWQHFKFTDFERSILVLNKELTMYYQCAEHPWMGGNMIVRI